jgi:hypothetical protein
MYRLSLAMAAVGCCIERMFAVRARCSGNERASCSESIVGYDRLRKFTDTSIARRYSDQV